MRYEMRRGKCRGLNVKPLNRSRIMRNANVWLCGVIVGVALAGTAMLVGTPSTSSAAPEPVVVKDHWRHHDGHWSYWYEPDKRWYYTDGSNWFFEDGDAWRVYGFDKGFGREGF